MVIGLCNSITSIFGFLEKRNEQKQIKEKKKNDEEESKNLKKVCDKGSLQDLIDFSEGVKK